MIGKMRDLQIPKVVEFEEESISSTYGKFYAEPFERGYGTTIGNVLRRILLSSMSGSAVTSVKIEGVMHEFSKIHGVKEDVTDIILNVKTMRIKMHSDKPKTIHLKKKGPGEATAKDIVHDSDIEILTPELHIASLDKDANIDIEFIVKRGRGYYSAERNKEEGMPIGVIPIDSIFSPIKRVNFAVENARVGKITDYDKLKLEIWTDGSISPKDALVNATLILEEHLKPFLNLREEIEEVELEQVEDHKVYVEEKKGEKTNKNLSRSVTELELSVRAANCLKNANIKTIEELVQKSEQEMLLTKNFGRKSLNEIKELLIEMGLGFGMILSSTEKK